MSESGIAYRPRRYILPWLCKAPSLPVLYALDTWLCRFRHYSTTRDTRPSIQSLLLDPHELAFDCLLEVSLHVCSSGRF